MNASKWYVGAQNDILYIIDQPPRPSNDDINPDRDVNVIAKVYPAITHQEERERADLLAAAPELLEACRAILKIASPSSYEFPENRYREREDRIARALDLAKKAVAKTEETNPCPTS